ncbi:MAG: hypothetical protein OXM01_13915 [Gemmatimonadota bacterium]|nr:hypothetical protein [Gemmatimonadota bacterium]
MTNNSNNAPLTFDISNSSDMLEELRGVVSDFKKDDLNPKTARHCAVIAWSMCDWIFKEHGSRLGYKKLDKLQEDVRNKCPEIEYLQNMADSLKHRNITSYTPSLVGAYKHRGAFSRDFARDFDISGLMLKLQDGSELWFEDVIEAALSFWDGYFKDNGI